MSSGGWLGKVVSAPLKVVSNVLGVGGNSNSSSGQVVKASDSVYPTVTGQDLVASTTAQQPESAVMGADNVASLVTNTSTRRKRGTASLYVKPTSSSSSSYTGRSGL